MGITLAMLARVLVGSGASDVLVLPGRPPLCRFKDRVQSVAGIEPLGSDEVEAWCRGFVGRERLERLVDRQTIAFVVKLDPEGAFRVLLTRDHTGLKVSLSRAPPAAPAPAPDPAPPPPSVRSGVADLLDEVLARLLDANGSDVHFKEGKAPYVRVDGVLKALEATPLTRDAMLEMVGLIIGRDEQRTFFAELQLDSGYCFKDIARFRTNLYHDHAGLGIAMRLIPKRIPSWMDLGLPPQVRGLIRSHGLLLITGPTGSGKTTTMASLIQDINERDYKHIITIENPIEFVYVDDRSSVSQREVYQDTPTFANGVTDALRQDPDVILVGELRDVETMSASLMAADAGKMVLATCHTSSAFQTVERILNAFPSEQQSQVKYQLAANLTGVVSQALVPRRGGGRALAAEIMVASDAVRSAIRNSKPQLIQSAIETGSSQGMQTLDQHLTELVVAGTVTLEDALAKCQSQQALQDNVANAIARKA